MDVLERSKIVISRMAPRINDEPSKNIKSICIAFWLVVIRNYEYTATIEKPNRKQIKIAMGKRVPK